jgi:GNAT superfamily N-acetyltransferase
MARHGAVSGVVITRVVPLTADRWDDLADLFGPNGADAGCWCMFFRLSNRDWEWAGGDGRREQLHARAGDDPAPGLLAYDGDEAVGWVGLGPRMSFERLVRSRNYPPLDDLPVWSVVCFFVRRTARSKGVTTALLDAAVEYAREHGAAGAEANAVAPGGKMPPANLYHGTVSTFERAGFRRAREVPASPGAHHVRWVMRLEFD